MPSKVPAGKVQINVLISEEVYRLLIEIAPQIHGKYRGALSAIVEEALRLYLTYRAPQGGQAPRVHTHGTHKAHASVPRREVLPLFMEVLSEIKRLNNYPEDEILCEIRERDLALAINNLKGLDRRTVKKYMKIFEEHKLIKYDRGSSPNMIFKVLIYPECSDTLRPS